MKIQKPIDESVIKQIDFDSAIVASALTAAAMFVEENNEAPPQTAEQVQSSGARFIIPLAVPEGVVSGDERSFVEGSVSTRDLPLPLMWQIKSGDGHSGSVVVGRIDTIERVENGLGNARGVFDVGVYGREAERLVRGKFLKGVSVDLDKFEASTEAENEDELSANSIKNQKIKVEAARLMGITIVPKPAFQECFIMIDEPASLANSDDVVEDGLYEEKLDDIDNELAALAASAAPVVPPREWFTDPKLDGATPLTITDEGKVYGHIAAWHVSHIGLPRATKPPRSASQYAYFRTGELRTTSGDVQVGQLTLAGGHASMQASAEEAVKHYDDTASAVADVIAGEDSFGIWVSGALRPDATPQQVRAFRASSPSGDWRPINGRLELVAVCQVNVPGFPVARTITAGGQVQALVAAGASYLAELRENQKFNDLDNRLKAIEDSELSNKKLEILKRITPDIEKKDSNLAALAASAKARLANDQELRDAEFASQIEKLKARFNS